ncbi:thioredoxin-like protein [Gloeopeniophorella convolvens]|nr:thioredoxin-like protein [Gloeopeniophorella convolvens]
MESRCGMRPRALVSLRLHSGSTSSTRAYFSNRITLAWPAPARTYTTMSEPRRSARLAASVPATAPAPATEAKPAARSAPTEEPPALAPIDIGDTLPSYTLRNEQGEDVDVSTLAAEQGVILFSIPRADTAGCTTQACGFRDIYPNFTEHNFTVYCLSHDTPEDQKRWQLKKELPYPLLSDPDRVLVAALGAKDSGTGKTKRGHFIFTKGGKLVEKRIPVSPTESPPLALEFVKSLDTKSAL